jgi:hypothetical protein
MANEKTYSERQAAIAVLAKAQEMMAKSELFKAEKLKKDGSIQAGIAAAGAAGGVPHTQTATPQGVQSGISNAFGKNEMCTEHGSKAIAKSECMKCMNKSKMGKSEFEELYEDLTKMEKSEPDKEHKDEASKEDQGAGNKEAPSSPPEDASKPVDRVHDDFAAKPGESSAPDHREAASKAPEANPKERAEGNNPPSGAIPGNGIHKLMYFTGHVHAKKKMKKGIALG